MSGGGSLAVRSRFLTLVTSAVVVMAPATPSVSASAAANANADGNVMVAVPIVPYEARDDRFRAGPYRSRLHVLFNDAGIPDPDRLQLVDDRGRTRPVISVPRIGNLRVADGFVVLDPVPGAEGTVSFSYQTTSANGPVRRAKVGVDVVPQVIATADDAVTTSPGTQVQLDVAANDRLLVPGAVRACLPQLLERRPPRVDPLPVVLPEPERPTSPCAGQAPLVTSAGQWRVDPSGEVVFTPALGFTGTARAYYRQETAYPFDLGAAVMSVRTDVAQGSTPDHGRPGDGTAWPRGDPDDVGVLGAAFGRSSAAPAGDVGGRLAFTGANLWALLLAATALSGLGLGLVATPRRRRPPPR